ncbi:hypothetical protein E4U57_006385 [Claviceps arundinis]|uniref:Uncharacterized protein n=1 Tax=Claviceps arundinis TaxID=1623583 RepID=A0A9P7SUJ1_9HYPO|nr:hypothetical protein E4U57_006385 [Claviceps arundinis]KAG5976993.1 hypothetical protein E4U56_000815 [Claviceps arundinis]
MAPETRSRGVPPPSRVYHATPRLQQVQFPSRRKKTTLKYSSAARKSFKQQTLTQIDFVSSFEEDENDVVAESEEEDGIAPVKNKDNDVIVLSDDEDDVIRNSDTSSGQEDDDKENAPPAKARASPHVAEQPARAIDDDDETPIPRRRKRVGASAKEVSKRRRTMGDNSDSKKKPRRRKNDESRRTTLGELPPSSRLHTQTLTQFLGRQKSFVADSDEELCGLGSGDEEQGFLSWLGELEPEPAPEPGSPSAGRGRRGLLSRPIDNTSAQGSVILGDKSSRGECRGEMLSRENSIIPQTPARKRSTTIRFDIPLEGLPSPSQRMMERYGAPDVPKSPLNNRGSSPMRPLREEELVIQDSIAASPLVAERRPSFEIQDSYATDEAWTTPSKSQTCNNCGTPRGISRSTQNSLCTPSKRRISQRQGSLVGATSRRGKTPSPRKLPLTESYEIPDSDEDEEGIYQMVTIGETDDEEKPGHTFDARYAVGFETQAVMSEIASIHGQGETQHPLPAGGETNIGASHAVEDGDDDASLAKSASLLMPAPAPPRSTKVVPKAWNAAKEEKDEPSLPKTAIVPMSASVPTMEASHVTEDNSDESSPSETAIMSKPLRKPLHPPSSHNHVRQPSQLWESQRVPASELQSLPSPSARSDIVLPISSASLRPLLTGHTLAVTTPFRIPSQVVRFWLLDNHLLRYMALVEPGEEQRRRQSASPPCAAAAASAAPSSTAPCSQPTWQFRASQVYELNNPVEEQDMREEGWFHGQIGRYSYLPPAVVGQLLWNLRHALFGTASQDAVAAETEASEAAAEAAAEAETSPYFQNSVSKHENSRSDSDRLPRRAGSSPPGSMTVSQQVTAQIHSDIAYSTQLPTSDDMVPASSPAGSGGGGGDQMPQRGPLTKQPQPEEEEPQRKEPPSNAPAFPQPSIFPSQATTLSQASTADKSPSQPHHASLHQTQHLPNTPSMLTDSVHFLTHSDSLTSLPFPSSLSSTSQILTKSQLLPESLIRDEGPLMQPEIWDSDEEDVSL